MKRILTIDGGGVRGMIPAVVIEELEHRTGKPVAESFDMISGTSIGGIIACAISSGYSGETIRKLVENRSKDIFKRRTFSGFSLIRSRYNNKNLRNVLNDYFTDKNLSDVSTELLIPAYDLTHSKPYYFTRRKAIQSEVDDFNLVDVAIATASAPIYFTPSTASSLANVQHTFVDGGVFANNPTGLAFSQARSLWPNEEFEIVSLGTGHEDVKMNTMRKYWGASAWVKPLIGIIFDGISDSVEDQIRTLPSIAKYDRFQAAINLALDDASFNGIRKLIASGKSVTYRTEFDALVTRLR